MDPITQTSQKLLLERLRQGLAQQRSPSEEAPPPYTSSDFEGDSDSDEDDGEDDSPLSLTINAAHSIQGSNNLVPTSPTPLADATKFSSLLLHAVNQLNNSTPTCSSSAGKSRRRLKVDLTINCGITVIGDRNVIGNVGLKARQSPPMAIAGPQLGNSAVAGAKRKAEEAAEQEAQPKKILVEEPSSS